MTTTTDTLSYDGLNRLTQSVISNPGLPLNVTKTVSYDAIGNITSKSDVGDYAYDPVHVHAVSGIAPGSTGTLSASFTYDGDGNLLTGKGRALAWTSFDMVSQIAQGANTLGFTYDSEHQQDHSGATKALRAALGNRLLGEQERRLARILGEKDAAEYGPRIKRKSEAARLLADLEKFAAWAELELTRAR